MPITPHHLSEEFPDQLDEMSALRASDAEFAALVRKYDDLNYSVHLAETDAQPTDDLHLSKMRKERLHLKDLIAAALRAAQDA